MEGYGEAHARAAGRAGWLAGVGRPRCPGRASTTRGAQRALPKRLIGEQFERAGVENGLRIGLNDWVRQGRILSLKPFFAAAGLWEGVMVSWV
jgi:hypothetical protein